VEDDKLDPEEEAYGHRPWEGEEEVVEVHRCGPVVEAGGYMDSDTSGNVRRSV
jgi:hypothetical protein